VDEVRNAAVGWTEFAVRGAARQPGMGVLVMNLMKVLAAAGRDISKFREFPIICHSYVTQNL
jgi:hypothetical protein